MLALQTLILSTDNNTKQQHVLLKFAITHLLIDFLHSYLAVVTHFPLTCGNVFVCLTDLLTWHFFLLLRNQQRHVSVLVEGQKYGRAVFSMNLLQYVFMIFSILNWKYYIWCHIRLRINVTYRKKNYSQSFYAICGCEDDIVSFRNNFDLIALKASRCF